MMLADDELLTLRMDLFTQLCSLKKMYDFAVLRQCVVYELRLRLNSQYWNF